MKSQAENGIGVESTTSGSGAGTAARARRRTFAITAAATFMGFIDVTIVNVSIPNMASSFEDATLSSLSWVLNGYTILFAALLVPMGRLADLVGRRRVFVGGVSAFTVASLLAAAAPSVQLLICARIVQGGAAAAMLPAALALLLADYPREQWTTAVASWGAVAFIASALGPLLGGLLIDAADWRLIFLINGPIGLATVLIGRRFLRESRDTEDTRTPDILGATLLAGSVALLVLGLVKSDDWGWTGTGTILCFGAAAVLATGLAFRLVRHDAPIFEPSLWRDRQFSVANVSTFLFGLAFYAMLLGAVIFLTQVWHYSILEAGLAMSPGPLAGALVAPASGRVAERRGYRLPVVIGGLVYLAAMVWLATVPGSDPDFLGEWLPGYALAGIGVGFVYPSQTSAAASAVPSNRFATGVSLNIALRQLGASVGIALLVSVLGTKALGGTTVLTAADLHEGFALCAYATFFVILVALGFGRAKHAEAESSAVVADPDLGAVPVPQGAAAAAGVPEP
jgi:EmrB/QacA subfamily drug resistance transporter